MVWVIDWCSIYTCFSCVYGARQVSGAIFASTLTTICVFLPIVFADGLTKQIFTDMGLTIAYSLVSSLVVSLTVVPAMASKLLEKVEETWVSQTLSQHISSLY